MSKAVKKLPSKNNEPTQATKEVLHYTLNKEGIENVVKALNDLIQSPYVKQAFMSALNDNIKPVYKE